MKVYKFIFVVGFLNLTIPFLSVPFVYKNYFLISLSIVTLGYALIVRAIEKEKQSTFIQKNEAVIHTYEQKEFSNSQVSKTIEDVVDMVEQKQAVAMSDVVVKRKGRKQKIVVHDQMYE
jgi:hypothetical protein